MDVRIYSRQSDQLECVGVIFQAQVMADDGGVRAHRIEDGRACLCEVLSPILQVTPSAVPGEPQILELRAAQDTAPDLDALTDEMLGYMDSFDEVVAEGTVEEKRRFARSFVGCVKVAGDRYRVEPEVALSAPAASSHS